MVDLSSSLCGCLPEGKPPFSYGFPMVFLWCSYGVPMVFLWFSYGFRMVFLLFSYGFPMVFVWCSYGFPMVFPLKPPWPPLRRHPHGSVSTASPARHPGAVPAGGLLGRSACVFGRGSSVHRPVRLGDRPEHRNARFSKGMVEEKPWKNHDELVEITG